MATAWVVQHSRTVLQRRWITVEEQRVLLPNGHEIAEYHLISAPSWTAVLALTEDDRVLLVRQYRHGLGAESLELPAGVIDDTETPDQAARRELLEETGYLADELRPLFTVAPEPARHRQLAHFFFAPRARHHGQASPDASEIIEVVQLRRQELVTLALSGGIQHGAHVGAILAAHTRGWLR